MEKIKLFLVCVLCSLQTFIAAQEDVLVIEGGSFREGLIEATINLDVNAQGKRNNPNRIYELKRGEFYLMNKKLDVDNPGGMLTIRAEEGEGPLPIILLHPKDGVSIDSHTITGSLALNGIQYHGMQTDGIIVWQNWSLSGDSSKLVVENCLFEYCNGDLFNTANVLKGLSIKLRNNYFRDFHGSNHWWGGRVVYCKTPVDTLIFENNTTTGAGLTILAQESLIDYAVINHNTIINNVKYPFLNQYWKTAFITNNLFVNANWVGEDLENVATGGQDPDALLHGLVGVDTITADLANIQEKYLDEFGNLTEDVDEISDYTWYAADNVCVASSTLDNYYSGGYNDLFNAPASYLTWSGPAGPFIVRNVPGIFMNERSKAIVAEHGNIKEENNRVYLESAEELGFGTDPLPQAAADVYAQWNRNQWGIPYVAAPVSLLPTYFGDYDPLTIPGIETEDSSDGGITRISDLPEDFSYSADLVSQSDGLPIGALHWADIEFDSEASLEAIKQAYYNYFANITFQVDLKLIDDLTLDGRVWLNLGSNEERYLMTDPRGDGIYKLAQDIPVNTVLDYSFSYQNGPDTVLNVVEEKVSVECAGDEGIRTLHVAFEDFILPASFFDSCTAGFYPVTEIEVMSQDGRSRVYLDSTLQMVAITQPHEATDTTVAWQVDNPTIAHIDPQNGLLTAIDHGLVKVSATANDESGISGELWIEVILLVQGIEINGNENLIISIGEENALHLDVDPKIAEDTRVHWSSEYPGIVRVDTLGLVTGVSAGTSTITASALDGSGVSASIWVHVMSNDATLSSLEANAGMFSPPFSPDTYIYALELPVGSTSVTISATANHERASVSGTGHVDITSGSGSAIVGVMAEDGSEEDYIIAIKVETTGLSLHMNNDMTIYPNPASDRIYLEGQLRADLNIYSSMGRLLLSGQNVNFLDVSGLTPGIYILKVKNGERSVSGRLILK